MTNRNQPAQKEGEHLEEKTKSQKASCGSQDGIENFRVGAPLASRGSSRISLLALTGSRDETSIKP